MNWEQMIWGFILFLHVTLTLSLWKYGPRKVDDTMTIYLWKSIRFFQRFRKSK